MAAKPSSGNSRWDTDGTNMTAPSSGQRDTGIVLGAAAVSAYINYLHNQNYLWAQYVDDGAFAGSFSLVSDISPSAITGTVNDYNPTGLSTAQVIRQDLSANTTVTGLAGGADGRIIVLINIDPSFRLSLAHASGSSSAANRFALPQGLTLTLRTGEAVILQYDSTATVWRPVAFTGTADAVTGITYSIATETSGDITLAPGSGGDVILDPSGGGLVVANGDFQANGLSEFNNLVIMNTSMVATGKGEFQGGLAHDEVTEVIHAAGMVAGIDANVDRSTAGVGFLADDALYYALSLPLGATITEVSAKYTGGGSGSARTIEVRKVTSGTGTVIFTASSSTGSGDVTITDTTPSGSATMGADPFLIKFIGRNGDDLLWVSYKYTRDDA